MKITAFPAAFPFIMIYIFLFSITPVYGESSFVLKKSIKSLNSSVPFTAILENSAGPDIKISIERSRFFENSELSALLRRNGIKDFILIGSGVYIEMNNSPSAHISYSGPLPALNISNVTADTRRRVEIDDIKNNTAKLVYINGGVTIKTTVRIIRKLENGSYIVLNQYSGKTLTVQAQSNGVINEQQDY